MAAAWVLAWPVLWTLALHRGDRARAHGWRRWAAWIAGCVVVAAVAGPLRADVWTRARIAKGEGDVLVIGKALEAYAAHCGGLPEPAATGGDCGVARGTQIGPIPLALARTQRNARGVQANGFLRELPDLPRGWTGFAGAYAYVVEGERAFRVCAAGDGVVAASRGSSTCP